MLEKIKQQFQARVKPKSLLAGLGNRTLYGMTNLSEQKYFQFYAREDYSGVGEIVDLGSWMGSTTISLAKGLRDNRKCENKKYRIHAFDNFIWESWMDIAAGSTPTRYKSGDTFLDEFKKRTERYSNYIKIYPSDLCQISWIGKEIEFLLIDAMKSWKLTSSICQNFFPYLVPGKSLILHQDFAHFYTSWIHLITYRFRNHFDFYHDVPNSPSVVLKYTNPISPEELEFDYSFNSFSVEEAESAFNYSIKSTPQEKHASIAAAHVMFFAHQGQYEKAKIEVERYLNQGYQVNQDLKNTLEYITERNKK